MLPKSGSPMSLVIYQQFFLTMFALNNTQLQNFYFTHSMPLPKPYFKIKLPIFSISNTQKIMSYQKTVNTTHKKPFLVLISKKKIIKCFFMVEINLTSCHRLDTEIKIHHHTMYSIGNIHKINIPFM